MSEYKKITSTYYGLQSVIQRFDEDKILVLFDLSLWESGNDTHYKLEVAMKYLNQVDKEKGPAFYMEASQKVMQHLHQEFQKLKEVYLPWVRFFDITARKKEEYPGKKEGSEGYLFRKGMEDLIIQLFAQNETSLAMDWRISKRILSVSHIFPDGSRLLSSIAKEAILQAFQIEIEKGIGQLIWLESSGFTSLAKETLLLLRNCFKDKSSKDPLCQAIITGRFDKNKFDLRHSLILGEDGGLYLLLNRLTKEQQKEMVEEKVVTETYLKDKIKTRPEDKDKTGDKVILGQGGFGKVRFALSLIGGKVRPGDVVCIKKTKSFFDLAPKHGALMPSALHEATKSIIDDYFASGVADKVYAPQVLDLTLVTDPLVNQQNDLSGQRCHQKGYLMMEVIPQNTATKVFKESEYQKWKYQKPFLQDILLATSELLKENIAFTDLKPDNVLFDPDSFKTTIIDLGGTIKLNSGDSLESFEKSKYSYQITPGYCAPEKQGGPAIINLSKALSYTCGKVIEEVVQTTDYDQQELKGLIDELTNLKPEKRISIEEALKKLKEMGDDTSNEDILLIHYINKIKGRIGNNRPSISLNEDLLTTKGLYIDLKTTEKDPEKHKGEDTQDLFQQIDHFLTQDQDQQQVMVIFGSAGTGKSIALQIKFIEAIEKWTKGQPLSIYFNLANGIELKTIINSINTELGTNLKLQELKSGIHLYIDSFDEGLEIEKKREILIKEYITELKNSNTKILLTCRSDFLESESSHSWFTPHLNAFNQLKIVYVTPMSYIGKENSEEKNLKTYQETLERVKLIKQGGLINANTLQKVATGLHSRLKLKEGLGGENEENLSSQNLKEYASQFGSGWRRNVVLYLKRKDQKMKKNELETTLERMTVMNLERLIDTGLMFHITMEVLFDVLQEESLSRSRSKQDIYLRYVSKYQKERLKKFTEEQRAQATNYTQFISQSQGKEFTLSNVINDLGKYLAVQLHLHDRFRLDQDAPILQALGYESQIHFKRQISWNILKLLPVKIETKHSNNPNKIKIQEVKLGFIHNTIKYSYLLAAIQDELSLQNGYSQILATKSIITDTELIKFIADAAIHDERLRNFLRKAIDLTKSNKEEKASIYAANSMTILVAAKYSFSAQDLSHINVKGASLKNGVFSGVDFTGADLSNTVMRNMQVDFAVFKKTNVVSAQLGILPDLLGHTKAVSSVSFSSDGKYIASGSHDWKIKIWEVQTSQCLITLGGHSDRVTSVSFSGNGKHLASGSFDATVKIWEVQTGKCVVTLREHTDTVWSVSFSRDGNYVASGSLDNTVRIWEAQTGKCFSTLKGHKGIVSSVSFSGDGKYLTSGSFDKTINIWAVSANEPLAILQGHTGEVSAVNFSHDGKYVASGSWDSTINIWEAQTNKCIATLRGHHKKVESVSFSGDGKYLASGSDDRTVKIWEMQTNKCMVTLQGSLNFVLSVSFSVDGRYLASSSEDGIIKIWNPSESTDSLIAQEDTGLRSSSVSFSRDGKYVASGLHDKTVKIWEVQTSQCLATLRGHTGMVKSVSFSVDGKYVASGSGDKTVKIWEVQTNKCVTTLRGHSQKLRSVSFSQDGKYLASGSEDQTVKIWETQSSQCLITLKGHSDRVTSVSFSADGNRLVSGSDDTTVRIWEMQTGECLVTLRGLTDAVWSVDFSHDGKYVVSGSGDSKVRVWEVQTSKCVAILRGHKGTVNSVSTSGDGKYFVSGSEDGLVIIWETQKNKPLALLQGHTDAINNVNFSSDGRSVVSASEDGTVKIWSNLGGLWLLDRHLGDTEPPISMRNMTIEDSVISIQNELVFQQRGATIKQNKTVIGPAIEMKHSSNFALETADELNTLFLNTQITAYKELERQKIVQINIPTFWKQPEEEKENAEEGLTRNKITDQKKKPVSQGQSDDPLQPSSTIGAKIDTDQISISVQKGIPQKKSEEVNKFEGQKPKQACCRLF